MWRCRSVTLHLTWAKSTYIDIICLYTPQAKRAKCSFPVFIKFYWNTALVGRIMAIQMHMSSKLEMCDYVTLHGKRWFAEVLKDCKMGSPSWMIACPRAGTLGHERDSAGGYWLWDGRRGGIMSQRTWQTLKAGHGLQPKQQSSGDLSPVNIRNWILPTTQGSRGWILP